MASARATRFDFRTDRPPFNVAAANTLADDVMYYVQGVFFLFLSAVYVAHGAACNTQPYNTHVFVHIGKEIRARDPLANQKKGCAHVYHACDARALDPY